MQRYVIALDQGTTTSRAVLINHRGQLVDVVQRPFQQIYPKPGWVEHNPQEILFSQLGALSELCQKHGLSRFNVAAIGIDNQRETTIVWDPTTGEPIYNAIVWQCRRTKDMVDEICNDEQVRRMIQDKTGLLPDAYFSASKIKWLLDNVEGARKRAEAGELLFGTVDTWLMWILTGALTHVTDFTNASRTMLFNIHTLDWDKELLELFNIPSAMLPEALPSSGFFGETAYPGIPSGIPIFGIAGDQQAALFGQRCFEPGSAKNTYGTGCFLLVNTGNVAPKSSHNLVTTLIAAAPEADPVQYALEGSVFVAGALIQWLRDELGLLRTAEESEMFAKSVEDTAGVYIVPAFTGLGAPHWDANARGTISGLTRGSTAAHIIRAALEAMAYQTYDLVRAIEADSKVPIRELAVDGGAARNNFLMQFQADILGTKIVRPKNFETTSLGAAYLAGLGRGFWKNTNEVMELAREFDSFEPTMDEVLVKEKLDGWDLAIKRCLS